MDPIELQNFCQQIPSSVTIVAATKYVDAVDMRKLYKQGIHHFGENRVEAFLPKYETLCDLPITWHFIGHLQKNKANQVLSKIDYLHSLDSLELAKIIEKKREEPLKCFVEVNISQEASKHGIAVKERNPFIEQLMTFSKIKIVGLMGMSKKDATPKEKFQQFKALAYLKERLNHDYHLELKELSMGMSDDYQEAISAGATMIRLGRILWKQKN